MRQFWSYGPPDPEQHFCVPRSELVERCVQQLVGAEGRPGHYFTMWAPRQAGKTWVMEQATAEIKRRCGDEFLVRTTSMQGIVMKDDDPADACLGKVPYVLWRGFRLQHDAAPRDWEQFLALFDRERGSSTGKSSF